MKTFLEYVARDIVSKHGTNLADTVIVFPNKRASLFLNEYLVRAAGKPVWSPVYTTISDLFREHSDLIVGDNIKLVCDLHKSFVACTGIDEPLDHFYGWGQLLLSDFDDIDKNMADAGKVFANLKDIHELDGVAYLSPEQIEAIKTFFSNFTEDHDSELKRRFLRLWSKFGDIYSDYNERLTAQGMAYEGALYRRVVTDTALEFSHGSYIFVGFNLLQKVERQLFKHLKSEGKACFYWDLDKYYMAADGPVQHEAGHYISSYLSDFPNELDSHATDIYDNFAANKQITYISAPTENIQARYVSKWLHDNGRMAAGRSTAVVLCNESLLNAVIHSLPDDIGSVNITTGYPLSQSPLSSLLYALIALQTSGYDANHDRYRLHYVNAVLNHPYACYISAGSKELHKAINTDAKVYYPDRATLCIDDGLSLLFEDAANGAADATRAGQITSWVIKLLKRIADNSADEKDPLFKESLFKMYTLVNRLDGLIASGDLTIDVITLQRLLNQVIQSTSIPFHGEPAVGVQVMGVLETRNLDFDHLLILSCNEGNMPKGVNDTSFIPYSIRKAHELTTVDNKVAVYSYYFHRLLQRATDITILYNNAVSNGNAGEMSRFMLQIMVESNHAIAKKALQSGQTPAVCNPREVKKSGHIMDNLLARFDLSRNPQALLTPSAINRYMRCQLQFYYNYVCNIKELQDDDEGLDNRVFGNIFHLAAQYIYEQLSSRQDVITPSALKSLLSQPAAIERAVDSAFNSELFKIKSGRVRATEYNGLQLINRAVIIMYLRRLIEIDLKQAPFSIVGLEEDVRRDFVIQAGGSTISTTIGGRVDRIDRISDGAGERLRVVDYKTGGKKIKPLPDIEAVFDPSRLKDHSDYYLQAMLYSLIAGESAQLNPANLPVSPALLFIQHTAGDDYDPTLCFGKAPITDVMEHRDRFSEQIKEKVNDMFNPDIPFVPTADDNICKTCPYAAICGL